MVSDEPCIDGLNLIIMLIKAYNPISQMDDISPNNKHCRRLVFLLKVLLDEIAVKDFYAKIAGKTSLRD